MSRLSLELKSHELKHGLKVKCPSHWRCRYCPLTYIGRCGKLRRFLDAGDWK